MDVLFDEKIITIQAYPHYYDFARDLRLYYDEYKFVLFNGGCQCRVSTMRR